MNRRTFLVGVASVSALGALSRAEAQDDAFLRALAAFSSDYDAIEGAASVRERYQRVAGEPAGAGQASSWRRASSTPISNSARDLIIVCEVSGQSAYERRYQQPVRPGGQSGITIGIGYDLGYASPDHFRAQWEGLLSAGTIGTLLPVLGLRGSNAEEALSGVRHVSVTWQQALSQFDNFLPYAVGKTEDTFRNSAELPPSCLGALVSLVYNRGPSLSASSDRRREMREIARLTRERNFAPIPEQIRAMKRLWQHDPRVRGLVERRELEALLFEQGLAAL